MAVVTNHRLNKRKRIVQEKREIRSETSLSVRLEQDACKLLEQHPHFIGRSQFVRCEVSDRVLRLDGCLPSYFLKQLAQEALRDLDGINEIENCIVVASPIGEIRDSALEEGPVPNELPNRKKPR